MLSWTHLLLPRLWRRLILTPYLHINAYKPDSISRLDESTRWPLWNRLFRRLASTIVPAAEIVRVADDPILQQYYGRQITGLRRSIDPANLFRRWLRFQRLLSMIQLKEIGWLTCSPLIKDSVASTRWTHSQERTLFIWWSFYLQAGKNLEESELNFSQFMFF